MHLLRAGGVDVSAKARSFDVKSFYAGRGGEYVEKLRQEWMEEYEFVLVDCHSGVTDYGSICTIQLPDILVLLFTTNEHGLMGSVKVAKRVREARRHSPYSRLHLTTIPVPSRIDRSVTESLTLWLDRFAQEVSDFYDDWLPEGFPRRPILEDTVIPYHPPLSVYNSIPALQERFPAGPGVGYAYESLAALLANDLEGADQLRTDRREYVRRVMQLVDPSTKHEDTFRELQEINKAHVEWLRKSSKPGARRADLSRGDYPSGNFAQKDWSEAIFVNTNLRGANFHGATLSGANFKGAHLEKANLINVKGVKANLEKAVMKEAVLKLSHFNEANFRGAVLDNAQLERADLSGADLRGASLDKAQLKETQLQNANLSDASLLGATGLKVSQFKGADLRAAKLPPAVKKFDELSEARTSSRWARFLFLALTAACLYSVYVMIFGVSDFLLLTNRDLPRWAVGGAPAAWFMRAAPLVLLIGYRAFLRLVQDLWEKVMQLPAFFPEGSSLHEEVSDWFMVAVAYPDFQGGVAKAWPHALNIFTRWLMPATMLLFWGRQLPLRDWPWNVYHVLLAVIALAMGWSYRRLGAKTLRDQDSGAPGAGAD